MDAEGGVKRFEHDKLNVTVTLRLFTKDRNACPQAAYSDFWVDQVQALCGKAFA